MNSALIVYIWGEEVGRLMWHQQRKLAYFNFNPKFLNGRLNIAPLTAAIDQPQSRMPIFGESERIYQKLPSFIADSLPDAWGSRLFEQWRIGQGISAANITPLEKLAFIGRRGMGALEFMPEIDRGPVVDRVDIMSLANLAKKILTDREDIKILPEESLTMQSLLQVGTSAGGRQPKAIIAIDRESGEIRSGQIEREGLDYYILKFGDEQRSSAELEMAYYKLARAAGIRMMESKLIEVEGVKHFLTSRFDRDVSGKLHIQTLAAIWPQADSYEQLLWVCRKLRLAEQDCEEVYRRMVFNILANNTDDHNKNFSFVMNRQGSWSLSPAYDMTYIFDNGGYLPNHEHCMMIRGKLTQITRDDVIQFAIDNGIRRPDAIIKDVVGSLHNFRSIATKYGVAEQWIGRIEATIVDHLKSWGECEEETSTPDFIIGNHVISNIRLEQAYKGNFHLIATVDGKQRKFVIGKNKEEYALIAETGIANITIDQLKSLAAKYF